MARHHRSKKELSICHFLLCLDLVSFPVLCQISWWFLRRCWRNHKAKRPPISSRHGLWLRLRRYLNVVGLCLCLSLSLTLYCKWKTRVFFHPLIHLICLFRSENENQGVCNCFPVQCGVGVHGVRVCCCVPQHNTTQCCGTQQQTHHDHHHHSLYMNKWQHNQTKHNHEQNLQHNLEKTSQNTSTNANTTTKTKSSISNNTSNNISNTHTTIFTTTWRTRTRLLCVRHVLLEHFELCCVCGRGGRRMEGGKKSGGDRKRKRDNTRHDKTRQDKTRQDKTRQDKTRQDKTRQDKRRQDKTRQDETRQDKCIYSPNGHLRTSQRN